MWSEMGKHYAQGKEVKITQDALKTINFNINFH